MGTMQVLDPFSLVLFISVICVLVLVLVFLIGNFFVMYGIKHDVKGFLVDPNTLDTIVNALFNKLRASKGGLGKAQSGQIGEILSGLGGIEGVLQIVDTLKNLQGEVPKLAPNQGGF